MAALQELSELLTRVDGRDPFPDVLVGLRALLGAEATLLYTPRIGTHGLTMERFQDAGAPRGLRPLVDATLRELPEALFYDAIAPRADQRNRVIEATAWIDRDAPGTWAASRLRNDVMAPVGLGEHKQLRALICDGPAMLGWFGAFLPTAPTPRQTRMLAAIVPAVQRRLALERGFDGEARTGAALTAALELLGAPAFVVDASGAIHEMNAAGRALLARDRSATLALLARGGQRTELRVAGLAPHWLVVLSGPRAISTRVPLTPRQRQVLELIVAGHTNAAIALQLQVGERAVELHVTALLDRFAVANRASLVAHVLAA